MLVGFHDGYLSGVKSAPRGSLSLWLRTPALKEYLVTIPKVSQLWVSSFTGSNVINAILFYESAQAPRDLLANLWRLDASSRNSLLDSRYGAFVASGKTLLEIATSDGCSVIADFDDRSDTVQIIEYLGPEPG
jgi:hypothetical protein